MEKTSKNPDSLKECVLEKVYNLREKAKIALEQNPPSKYDTELEGLVKTIKDIIAFSDVIESTVEELYTLAVKDSLTQLYNRAYFDEVIRFVIGEEENTTVIMIDVDNFGRYNNTYGHQQGDHALKNVAGKIKEVSNTKFVARYEGEEFSVIIVGYNANPQEAVATAERIREVISSTIIEPFSLETILNNKLIEQKREQVKEFFESEKGYLSYLDRLNKLVAGDHNLFGYIHDMQLITVSIGVATKTKGENVESVIHRADLSLYKAKNSGKNKVVQS